MCVRVVSMCETSWVYLYLNQKNKEFGALVLTGVLSVSPSWAKCAFSNVLLWSETISDG